MRRSRPRRRTSLARGLTAVAVLWLAGKLFWVLKWLLLAAILVVLWPVTVTGGLGYLAALIRGWPAARLCRIAAWSLPYVAVYLIAAAVQAHRWQDVALSPVRAWEQASELLIHGRALQAAFLALPPAFPLGILAAAGAWAIWSVLVTSGLGGWTEFAPVIHDARQWRNQSRAAYGTAKAPGKFPLTTRGGGVPVGPVIRTSGHRWRPVLTIPVSEFRRHMVAIGASGSGKTNLLIRLMAGWYAAALADYGKQAKATGKAGRRKATGRPLLVVLDCKGGADARSKADRVRRILLAAGATRVRIWPDATTISMWDLAPRDLGVLLHQLIEHGTGNAAYYADMSQAMINLAVLAPPGPPSNAREFLARLDADWLEDAYRNGTPDQRAAITGASKHLGDIQLRYQTLLARLGPELDGPGSITDADAWYFILEGTREQSVAEAQAMALTELVAHAATATGTEPREILLVADDYSAVSGRVPMSNLYERGRSLGLGVIVSAQSWHGLGATEDERYRIAATADGGLWVMKTPHPQPLVEFAGTRPWLESARKLIGATFGDEGTSRVQHQWTADPNLIRKLRIGQACYIRDGGATYILVARAKPSPVKVPLPAPRKPPPRQVIIPPARVAPPDGDGPGHDGHPGEDQETPAKWPVAGRLEDVLGPEPGARPGQPGARP
jgi:hypothetical protein